MRSQLGIRRAILLKQKLQIIIINCSYFSLKSASLCCILLEVLAQLLGVIHPLLRIIKMHPSASIYAVEVNFDNSICGLKEISHGRGFKRIALRNSQECFKLTVTNSRSRLSLSETHQY